MFTHSLTESGLTIFPLFCSGAISWRLPLAASEAALRIPLPPLTPPYKGDYISVYPSPRFLPRIAREA